MDEVVKVAEELDGFEILSSAELVGDPLAFFARIIKIKHRSNRIDAQPIDVIALTPKQGIGGQEIPHLVAAIIKNQGSPILMRAFAGVFMLIKRSAIESGQRP